MIFYIGYMICMSTKIFLFSIINRFYDFFIFFTSVYLRIHLSSSPPFRLLSNLFTLNRALQGYFGCRRGKPCDPEGNLVTTVAYCTYICQKVQNRVSHLQSAPIFLSGPVAFFDLYFRH